MKKLVYVRSKGTIIREYKDCVDVSEQNKERIQKIHFKRFEEILQTSDNYCVLKCKKHGNYAVTMKYIKASESYQKSMCPNCAKDSQQKAASITLKTSFIKENGHFKFTCEECGHSKMLLNTARNKRRSFCSQGCQSKASTRVLINFNTSPRNRVLASKTMNRRHDLGEIVLGGFAQRFQHENLNVQGVFELEMCKALDILKSRHQIMDWQYSPDKVVYINEVGNKSTYLIDFKVFVTESIWFYVETKGFAVLKDMFKWNQIGRQFPFKFFMQKEEMKSIIENPEYVLNKRTYNKMDVSIASESAYIKKQLAFS